MARLDRVPAIVESLLNPSKVLHVPPNLSAAPIKDKTRLRYLCSEMAARILDETDDTRFGDMEAMVDEAAELAFELGFPNPPIERIKYERGVNYEDVEEIHQECRAGFSFGGGERLLSWPVYRDRYPDFISVFGYRLHDPDRGSVPVEIHITALAERDDPEKPRTYDPWEHTSKAEHRSEAVKRLGRWVRFMDQPPAVEPESSEAEPDPAVTKKDAGPEAKAKPEQPSTKTATALSGGESMETKDEDKREPTPAEIRAWKSYCWVCEKFPNLVPSDSRKDKRFAPEMYQKAIEESGFYHNEDKTKRLWNPGFGSWKRNITGYEQTQTKPEDRPNESQTVRMVRLEAPRDRKRGGADTTDLGHIGSHKYGHSAD